MMDLLIQNVATFEVITFLTDICPLLANILYIVILNNYIIIVCSYNALPLPQKKNIRCYILQRHPHIGIIISGDFNHLPERSLKTHYRLKHIVTVRTRGDATLEKI